MRLERQEAIEYAEAHGLKLNKYADPIEEASEGLTPDEARAIATEDSSLIYIDISSEKAFIFAQELEAKLISECSFADLFQGTPEQRIEARMDSWKHEE